MAPNLLKSLFEELLEAARESLSPSPLLSFPRSPRSFSCANGLRNPFGKSQIPEGDGAEARKKQLLFCSQAFSPQRSRGWVNVCLLARFPWAWRGETELLGSESGPSPDCSSAGVVGCGGRTKWSDKSGERTRKQKKSPRRRWREAAVPSWQGPAGAGEPGSAAGPSLPDGAKTISRVSGTGVPPRSRLRPFCRHEGAASAGGGGGFAVLPPRRTRASWQLKTRSFLQR